MKRGAYFFVLDAFIAGIIIVSTMSVVFAIFSVQDDSRQSYSLAENFMAFLENTELRSYGGEARFQVASNPGYSSSYTLLEQIVVFNELDNLDAAEILLNDTMRLAPSNAGVGFNITNGTSVESLYYDGDFIEQSEARLGVVSRRIVISPETNNAFVAEVHIWQ